MSLSSRAGAESTENAEQKSGLPYMEGPRLADSPASLRSENGGTVPHPLSQPLNVQQVKSRCGIDNADSKKKKSR